MAKVATHVADPSITIEHWIHRLETGAYTYTTRTSVTIDSDVQHAAEIAADLARKADDVARKELVRRLTKDVQTFTDPEVQETWREVQTLIEEQKIS